MTVRIYGLDKRFRPAICEFVRLTEIRLSERSAAMRERGKGIGVAEAEFKTEEKSPKARKQTARKAKHRVGVKIYITRTGHKDILYWRGQRLAREINIGKRELVNGEEGKRKRVLPRSPIPSSYKYASLFVFLCSKCAL